MSRTVHCWRTPMIRRFIENIWKNMLKKTFEKTFENIVATYCNPKVHSMWLAEENFANTWQADSPSWGCGFSRHPYQGNGSDVSRTAIRKTSKEGLSCSRNPKPCYKCHKLFDDWSTLVAYQDTSQIHQIAMPSIWWYGAFSDSCGSSKNSVRKVFEEDWLSSPQRPWINHVIFTMLSWTQSCAKSIRTVGRTCPELWNSSWNQFGQDKMCSIWFCDLAATQARIPSRSKQSSCRTFEICSGALRAAKLQASLNTEGVSKAGLGRKDGT